MNKWLQGIVSWQRMLAVTSWMKVKKRYCGSSYELVGRERRENHNAADNGMNSTAAILEQALQVNKAA